MKHGAQMYQEKRHAERYPDVRLSKSAGGKKFIYDNRKGRDVTTPVAQVKGDRPPFVLLVETKVVLRASSLDECLSYTTEHLLPR